MDGFPLMPLKVHVVQVDSQGCTGQGKVGEFYFESGKIDILKQSKGKLK